MTAALKAWLVANGRGFVMGVVLAFGLSGLWLLYHEWRAWTTVRDFVLPIIAQQQASQRAKEAAQAPQPATNASPVASPAVPPGDRPATGQPGASPGSRQ